MQLSYAAALATMTHVGVFYTLVVLAMDQIELALRNVVELAVLRYHVELVLV